MRWTRTFKQSSGVPFHAFPCQRSRGLYLLFTIPAITQRNNGHWHSAMLNQTHTKWLVFLYKFGTLDCFAKILLSDNLEIYFSSWYCSDSFYFLIIVHFNVRTYSRWKNVYGFQERKFLEFQLISCHYWDGDQLLRVLEKHFQDLPVWMVQRRSSSYRMCWMHYLLCFPLMMGTQHNILAMSSRP